MQTNPVIYFEIPVKDLTRAVEFYTYVFAFEFDYEIIDGHEMAFFPFNDQQRGITGALAKGDVYQPSTSGVIMYFNTNDIETTLERVMQQNGKILYPKTFNEKYHFYVAEFEDSEGNRIAVQQVIDLH